MDLQGIWLNYHSGNCPLPDQMHIVHLVNSPNGQQLWAHVLKQEVAPLRSLTYGFLLFDNTNWALFTSEEIGLSPLTTTVMACDQSGSLWGYIPARAIFRFDGRTTEIFNPGKRGLPSELGLAFSLACDHQGGLWVAMQPGGVLYYNTSLGQSFRQVRNALFGNDDVTNIIVDKAGRVWFAVQSQTQTRFIMYNGEQYQEYTRAPIGYRDSTVQSMMIDRKGDLWVGWGILTSASPQGLWVFNQSMSPRQWTKQTRRNSRLPNHEFRSIVEDKLGRVWIGTSIGFVIFDGKQSVRWNVIFPDTLHGPVYVSDSVEVEMKVGDRPHAFIDSFAVIDNQERLWVRSNNGLSVFIEAK